MTNAALGFSNFVDKVVTLGSENLDVFCRDPFLTGEPGGAKFKEMLAAHLRGQPGREYVVDREILAAVDRSFEFRTILGGTSVRVAVFLDSLNVPAILHTNATDAALDTAFPNGNIRVFRPEETQERVHYIIEYNKGDVLRVDATDIVVRQSDRIILVPSGESPPFPLERAFFSALDNETKVLFVCSLNSAKTAQDLSDLAAHHLKQIQEAKQKLPSLKVYFEDCGHHDLTRKAELMSLVAPLVDIYGCNETEILDFCHSFGIRSTGSQAVVDVMEELGVRYSIPTIIVHAREFVLVRGAPDQKFLEAVKFGILSATHWYLTGSNPTLSDYRRMKSFGDSDGLTGVELPPNYAVVPTKITGATEGRTLGLGDCFAGAVVASLVCPGIHSLPD